MRLDFIPSPQYLSAWRLDPHVAVLSLQRPIIFGTSELECQAGDDKRRKENRQEALSGASEADDLAVGSLEVLNSAGVSATAQLQGVTTRSDWNLDRLVHFDRSGDLTVNDDVVRTPSHLGSNCLVRHLQRCCHLRSPLSFGLGPVTCDHCDRAASGSVSARWGIRRC